jgi:E3 ubiquitin-protein ligase MARCH5
MATSHIGDPDVIGSNHIEEDNKRYCWVCFATDEDDTTAPWVQPCNCRGTTKWVHQACIRRWVDEKQEGNPSEKVSCPQCNTQYIIVFPHMGPVIVMLDAVDNVIYIVCRFVHAGIVIGSIYWTAVTYGALTVMQVVGHKEGLSVMEQAGPLVLLVGLPTIPIMLILGKMVRWEDSVLAFLRRNSNKVPFLKYVSIMWRGAKNQYGFAASVRSCFRDPNFMQCASVTYSGNFVWQVIL